MKHILLVDVENTPADAFSYLAPLSQYDTEITFFVTTLSKPLSSKILVHLQEAGHTLHWRLIEPRLADAYSMDFHITTHILNHSKKMATEPCSYFILSTDPIFANLSTYLSNILQKTILPITNITQLSYLEQYALPLTF